MLNGSELDVASPEDKAGASGSGAVPRFADFTLRAPTEPLPDYRRRCWELVLSNRPLIATAIRLKYRPRTRDILNDLISFASTVVVERLSRGDFDSAQSTLSNWVVKTVGWSLGNRGFFEVTGFKKLEDGRTATLVPMVDFRPTSDEWVKLEPAARAAGSAGPAGEESGRPAGEAVFATAREAIRTAPMDQRKKAFLEASLVDGVSGGEMAERNGVSRQRVQQITSAAMARFRETLHVTEAGRRLEEFYEVFREMRA